MITAKFYKKIPKKIINQCPELMVEHTSDAIRCSDDNSNWFAFFNENNEVVGCLRMTWDKLEYVNGFPSWTLYIDLFETCKKFKHCGYARQMVEWLEKLPQVHTLELVHVNKEHDYGVSYGFWSHMGWKSCNKNTNYMRKVIQ